MSKTEKENNDKSRQSATSGVNSPGKPTVASTTEKVAKATLGLSNDQDSIKNVKTPNIGADIATRKIIEDKAKALAAFIKERDEKTADGKKEKITTNLTAKEKAEWKDIKNPEKDDKDVPEIVKLASKIANKNANDTTNALHRKQIEESRKEKDNQTAKQKPAAQETKPKQNKNTERSVEPLEMLEEAIQSIPAKLNKRYDINDKKFGTSNYKFKDTKLVAFKDKGKKITTDTNDKLVADSIVVLAESKGWKTLNVKGDEAFRKEIWMKANAKGIEVKGYKPTEQDKENLSNKIANTETTINKVDTKTEDKAHLKPAEEKKSELNDQQAQFKKSLNDAHKNLSQTEATKKHPELGNVYKLQEAAKQFASSAIKNDKSRSEFVAKVADKGITEIAKNGQLNLNLKHKKVQTQQAALGR